MPFTAPLHEQYFEDLSSHDLTWLHLNASTPHTTKDLSAMSTLAVINREVRSAMGNEYSKNIIPVMGMVAIIEQLGEAYKRTDLTAYPNTDASSFKKSLYYFNGQSPNDQLTQTLYGLRNAVVHNASFYSPGRGNQPNYIFTYDYTTADVIVPAATPWDGRFTNIRTDYFTTVNPEKLLQLAEHCMSTAASASEAGKLEIVLPGGKNELIFRYFKWKRL